MGWPGPAGLNELSRRKSICGMRCRGSPAFLSSAESHQWRLPSRLSRTRSARSRNLVTTGGETDVCVLAAVLDDGTPLGGQRACQRHAGLSTADNHCFCIDICHASILYRRSARRLDNVGQGGDQKGLSRKGRAPSTRSFLCAGSPVINTNGMSCRSASPLAT